MKVYLKESSVLIFREAFVLFLAAVLCGNVLRVWTKRGEGRETESFLNFRDRLIEAYFSYVARLQKSALPREEWECVIEEWRALRELCVGADRRYRERVGPLEHYYTNTSLACLLIMGIRKMRPR